MSELKYLAIGCPRSGTGYVSQLLTAGGIPCSHEGLYNVGGEIADWWQGEWQAESSWLAVPHLAKIPSATTIVRVMRDPVASIRSMVRIGLFSEPDNKARAFIYQHCPGLRAIANPFEAAVLFWADWDERIKRAMVRHGGRCETFAVDADQPEKLFRKM